jgi:hypothetical protein
MATGKKGSGSQSGKSTVGRKAATPADLAQPLRSVQDISRLCEKMALTPDVETARELRFRADEMENFFAAIRHSTHQYIEAVVSELEAGTKSKAANGRFAARRIAIDRVTIDPGATP